VIEVPFEVEVQCAVADEPSPDVAPAAETLDPDPSYYFWRELLRATQGWIQWGTFGFAVLCIVVGAVESLFGR
jgi:hypothetical protein